ncbi:Cysteine protease ATG4C [Blattella germanica]|nr:Cysteine protease ATG4C [Blattella germanica]
MELASKENQLLEQLCVYVAQDCAVYNEDVIELCKFSNPNLNARGESKPSKSLILLVPLRLGAEKLNAVYAPQLTYFLTLETCIGIIGGRPKHSLYFVGFQDDKLIHLDPHYCQEVVDVWHPDFPLWSFHCRSPRKMNLMKLDPSCCIGFYFKSLEEYESFRQKHNETDDRWHHPLFVFCDGRRQDALTINPFSIPEDSIRYSEYYHETDDELESEEFEIL